MPHPCPHHCPKDSGGGTAVVVAFVAFIAVAVAAPAASAVAHTAVEVVEFLAIGTGAAVVLGSVAVAVFAVHVRREAVRRSLAASRQHPRVAGARVAPGASEAVTAPRRKAISGPRASLADVKAAAAQLGYDVVLRGETED